MAGVSLLLERYAMWVRQDGSAALGYGAPMANMMAVCIRQHKSVSPLPDCEAMVVDRAMGVLLKRDSVSHRALMLYYVDRLNMQGVGNVIYRDKSLSVRVKREKATSDVRNAERYLDGLFDGLKEFNKFAA